MAGHGGKRVRRQGKRNDAASAVVIGRAKAGQFGAAVRGDRGSKVQCLAVDASSEIYPPLVLEYESRRGPKGQRPRPRVAAGAEAGRSGVLATHRRYSEARKRWRGGRRAAPFGNNTGRDGRGAGGGGHVVDRSE